MDRRQVRNKKVKSREIKGLEDDSTDIFHPFLKNDYYPNRPKVLEQLSLYDFVQWYVVTAYLPKKNPDSVFEIRSGLYMEKRKKPILINHYQYSLKIYPEKYYFALLFILNI